MAIDLEFNKNEDAYKQLCYQLKTRLDKVKLGGGEKKIAKHHEKGKLTARERIAFLTDENTDFLEIGGFCSRWNV